MKRVSPHQQRLLEDPELIVNMALDTVGLNSRWLAKLMNIPESALSQRLSIKHLKGVEWFRIATALYISGDSISFGYLKMEHKAIIRNALQNGNYYLPKTWQFWKLRFEIWRDALKTFHFQSKHYGFRLRWKARYQDFSIWLKRKLWREGHENNPVQQAWEFFHEGKVGYVPFWP